MTVSHKLVAAPEHTGMGQFLTEVVVTEIGVGVEMHDIKVIVLVVHSPDRTEGHKVLTAYHERQLTVTQYLLCTFGYIRNSSVGVSEGQLKVAAVEVAVICHVLVLVWTVCLDAEALVPYG